MPAVRKITRTASLPVRSMAFQSAADLVRRHPVLRVQQDHGVDLARRQVFQELTEIGVHRNDQAGAVAHALELAALQIRRQAAVAGTGIAAMQRLPGEVIGVVGMTVDQAQQPLMQHLVERASAPSSARCCGGMPRLNNSAGVRVMRRASARMKQPVQAIERLQALRVIRLAGQQGREIDPGELRQPCAQDR